jgi:hypothetical protein
VAFAVILQGQALRVSDEISNSAFAEIVFHRKTLPITKPPLLIAKFSYYSFPSFIPIAELNP